MIIPNRWVVEIWTPSARIAATYEGMDVTAFDDPREALAFAKKETKGGYSSATIRPDTQEWETWEFEKALESGEIT
jgi:hypothetical protein